MPVLTPDDVRLYISDNTESNHLLDDVEFTDERIALAIRMAISQFNAMTPTSVFDDVTFPDMSILMMGTLYHLFLGQSGLKARNNMNYSDGGLVVPVEEQFPLYAQLAEMYRAMFMDAARNLKNYLNIESGWGSLTSDYANFPSW